VVGRPLPPINRRKPGPGVITGWSCQPSRLFKVLITLRLKQRMSNRNRPNPRRRNARRLVGTGDYTITDQGSVAKAISDVDKRLNKIEKATTSTAKSLQGKAAGVLGRAAGTMLGSGDLGQAAGEGLAKWFGYGDYNLTRNSLILPESSDMGLKFATDGKRGIRIMEREYLGDVLSGALVSGSTEFTNEAYPINPGSTKTFPWLSKIAVNFDQWKPNGIIFEFKSTSSTFNGASQALGVVVAATDYDVLDPLYATKVEMETADYSNSCKASDNLMHGIECEAKERPDSVFFVRRPEGTSDSLRFYDLGNFQIATKGMSTANVVLGELWVTYDITFYKKQLSSTPLVSCAQVYTANSTHSDFFGDYEIYGTIPVTVATGLLTGVVYFPPTLDSGTFIIDIYGDFGTSGPALGYGFTAMTPLFQYGGDTDNSGEGASKLIGNFVVRITGPNASILFNTGGPSWGASELVINIARVLDELPKLT